MKGGIAAASLTDSMEKLFYDSHTSAAYSTWYKRPLGLNMVVPESYFESADCAPSAPGMTAAHSNKPARYRIAEGVFSGSYRQQ